VTNAERQVVQSETALNQAESQVDIDSASGQVSIENAQQSVVAAQNDLDAAQNDRPADVDEKEAAVAEAAAAVAAARRDVEERVLIAPTAGLVSGINGAVGEYVGAASGTTPLAPGTTARLPDTSDDAPATTDGAGTFLVLDDVDTFQMVVSFEESDATRIAPNQRVEVSVDAVPGLTLPGTVLAVAPAGKNDDGVIEFAVTVVLAQGDPQLRDGQTADASVLVDAVEDVLRVPNAAVGREMGHTVVRIPGEDGEPIVVPFDAGLVGDDFTEVRSGLQEGQIVLLPQGRVVASPPQGGPPPRR
jgi:HlyD family secretion protein